jgi:hypothetical protein
VKSEGFREGNYEFESNQTVSCAAHQILGGIVYFDFHPTPHLRIPFAPFVPLHITSYF